LIERAGKNVLTHWQQDIVWKRTFHPGYIRHPRFSFGLCGINENYAIVSSANEAPTRTISILEIVNLVDGETVTILDLTQKIRMITNFQTCHGRIGVQGWRYIPQNNNTISENKPSVDIFVYDIKSGDLLVSLTDLGFDHCPGHFYLEKDRLTFYNYFRLYSIRFLD
jgi:hypothetical protein